MRVFLYISPKYFVLFNVDNIILSKIEWLVIFEFVSTKLYICVFIFYIAYFPSKLENKDSIKKEIKQRKNITDLL